MSFFVYCVIAIGKFRSACARRPSGSALRRVGVSVRIGTTIDGAFVATTGNGVVSTHHVGKRSCLLMSFGGRVTSGTRVARIAAQSMSPAVEVVGLSFVGWWTGVSRSIVK